MLSLLTGSLSVALLALYHENKAVLIVIACACYLHSVIQLFQLFIPYCIHSIWVQGLFCLLQLVTLGSTIEFFHYWTRNMVPLSDALHHHIMLAFESSLLFLLLINGLHIGTWMGSQAEFGQDQDLHDIESLGKEDDNVPFVANNKFVPMKDSAQTLTPQMYNVQMGMHNHHDLFNENDPNNINSILQKDTNIVNSTKITRDWMKNETSHSKPSESNSGASVIRHQLDGSRTQSLKGNNINNKLRSFSSSSNSSKKSSLTVSPLKSFQVFKFKSPKKFSFRQKKLQKENELSLRDSQDKRSIGLNTKYVTRLSTISDLHKSFINLLGTSTSEDGLNNTRNSIPNNNINKNNTRENRTSPVAYHHTSFIELSGQALNDEQFQNESPKLTQERIAIGRINNALLPPCLQSHDTNLTNKNNHSFHDILTTNSTDTPSFLIPEMSENGNESNDINMPSQEVLLNDLNDLSQIPNLGFSSDKEYITPTEKSKTFEYPPKISLDMWEKNKIDFMRKASEQSQNSTLLSPFQFNLNPNPMQSISESPLLESKQRFSFPKKNKLSDDDDEVEHTDEEKIISNDPLKIQSKADIQADKYIRNISDTISELDKYLNEFEASSRDQSQILEESLQQENTSTSNILASTNKMLSHEITGASARHSPTKSIVSIISGGANGVSGLGIHRQRSQNLTFGTPLHARGNSQYSFSQIANTSSQSSPTKQRFKRIGKKLSLSNISDSMFSDSDSKYNHSRNQSVEFTYIRDLQNNRHSPSKSISAIPMNTMSSHVSHNSVSKHRTDNEYAPSETPKKKSERRHSMAAMNKMIRSASSVFYKQSNVSIGMSSPEDATNEFVFKQPVMEKLAEERKVSNQTSLGSDNVYPDIVTSEYDREKWNTMKDLNMIDNEGHLKGQQEVPT